MSAGEGWMVIAGVVGWAELLRAMSAARRQTGRMAPVLMARDMVVDRAGIQHFHRVAREVFAGQGTSPVVLVEPTHRDSAEIVGHVEVGLLAHGVPVFLAQSASEADMLAAPIGEIFHRAA